MIFFEFYLNVEDLMKVINIIIPIIFFLPRITEGRFLCYTYVIRGGGVEPCRERKK